jgi:ethanolamine utilization protein EutQ (cupin superfamily)
MSEQNAWRGSADENPAEPFDVGRGTVLGRVFWIRKVPHLQVGLWSVSKDDVRTAPAPYVFTGDETIIVLAGEVEVDVEPDTKVHLRAGEIASFKKGATSQWNILSDEYKELFVYAL